MTERSEEARASGLLQLTIGGQRVELPVLRIRQAREWRKALDATKTADGLDGGTDVMLGLLVAYDVTGILGGRDALEDRATDPEIYEAFREVMAATFPFVRHPELVWAEEFMRRLVQHLFLQGNSTNGASTPGGSTPTLLRRASRTSNSSSSTKRARSA